MESSQLSYTKTYLVLLQNKLPTTKNQQTYYRNASFKKRVRSNSREKAASGR